MIRIPKFQVKMNSIPIMPKPRTWDLLLFKEILLFLSGYYFWLLLKITRFLHCASACDRVTWNSFFTERYTWDTLQASKTPCTALERISLESDSGGRVWYNSPIVYIYQRTHFFLVRRRHNVFYEVMGHTVYPSYELQELQVLSL